MLKFSGGRKWAKKQPILWMIWITAWIQGFLKKKDESFFITNETEMITRLHMMGLSATK